MNKEKVIVTLKNNVEKFNRWRRLYKVLRANLSGANLSRANLFEAKSIIIFNKIEGRICYAVVHGKFLYVKAGCFWGNLVEFENACKQTYGDNKQENYHIQLAYLTAIEKSL